MRGQIGKWREDNWMWGQGWRSIPGSNIILIAAQKFRKLFKITWVVLGEPGVHPDVSYCSHLLPWSQQSSSEVPLTQ